MKSIGPVQTVVPIWWKESGLGISELLGIGQSAKRQDAIKMIFSLLMVCRPCQLAMAGAWLKPMSNSRSTLARLAGRAGVKIHVFRPGEEVVNFPWAVQGISKESGGTYTPLSRPAEFWRSWIKFPLSGSITCRSLTRLPDKGGKLASRCRRLFRRGLAGGRGQESDRCPGALQRRVK